MSVRPLRAFVSSKMQELADERQAIKAALDDMRIESFVFEKDAGARSQAIQDTYLEEIEAADLYIGVFWKGYGQYTIEEYEHAEALGMDCLIYEKREGVEEQRHPELSAFLERLGEVQTGRSVRWFHAPDQLTKFVKDDVARWQAEKIREAESPRGTRLFLDVPRTPSHFGGRDDLSRRVVRCLKAGHDVAMTGLPGVGKSTVAAALARHKGILRHFRNGILWGSLGPDGDPNRTVSVWAAALGVSIDERSQRAQLSQSIREAIGDRSVLLILDDAWQLEAAKSLRLGGPQCVHLLTTRDLAIARSFAGVENIFEVPPLKEDNAIALLRRLAPEAAAADDAGLRNVAKTADGLPLALELIGGFLAAPERSLFPELTSAALEEISKPERRLQLALDRLGAVDVPELTLQETILLSLNSLPQPAIDAFYRLGVFAPRPSTFDLEAAKAVVSVDAKHLAVLVARSLVPSAGGDRLELHGVVSDVANAKAINRDAVRLRHAQFYARLVSEALREYTLNNESRTPGSGSEAYRRDRQQVDAAVEWLISQEPSKETDHALLQIGEARQYMSRAAIYEVSDESKVRHAAMAAARRAGRPDAKARLQLIESSHLHISANVAKMRGRLAEAARLDERALELARQARDIPKNWSSLPGATGDTFSRFLGDSHDFALLSELSDLWRDLGKPREAIRYGEQSLALAHTAEDKTWESTALGGLARLHGDLEEDERALEYLEQRLPLIDEAAFDAGDRAETLGNLGVLSYRSGRSEEAVSYLEEALKAAEEAGKPELVRADVSLLARIHEEAGRRDESTQYLLHQLKIVRFQLGLETTEGKSQAEVLTQFFGSVQASRWRSQLLDLATEQAEILEKLGSHAMDRSEHEAAIIAFTGALSIARDLQDTGREAVTLANLASAYRSAGNAPKAVESYESATVKLRESENWQGFFLATEHLTNIYVNEDETLKAIQHLEAALQVASDLGHVSRQLEGLDRLGSAHAIVGERGSVASMKEAIGHFERGLDLAVEIKNEEKSTKFQGNLIKARAQLIFMQRK